MPRISSRPWRIAAGWLLAVEALWWAANTVIVASSFSMSPTAELLSIIPVALMALTLLAIFLLVQAPRGGVWMGLLLQPFVLAHGVLLLAMSMLVGPIEFALAIITALCLAPAVPRTRRT